MSQIMKKFPFFLYYDLLFCIIVLAVHKVALIQPFLSVLFLIGFLGTLLEIGIRVLKKYEYFKLMSLKSLITFAILAFSGNIYIYLFFTREKMIQFWDSSLYWSTSIIFTDSLFNNFNATAKMLYASILNDDYNMVPVIALSLPMKLFGFSYKIFALSIYNLYLIPAIFITILLIKKIIKDNNILTPTTDFLSLSVPFLFTPFIIPLMSGYLDAAGLFFVALLLVLVYSDNFVKIDLFRDLSFMMLLILLLFTRRWYAYFGIALIISWGFTNILRQAYNKHGKINFKRPIMFIANMCLIGSGCLFIFLVFFREFIKRSLFNNYSQMYSAYQSGSYINNLDLFIQYIGLLLFLIILIGIVFLYRNHKNIYYVSLLLLLLLISFSLFVSVQSLGVQHYYIMVIPLCILLTIGSCWLSIRKNRSIEILTSSIIIVVFLINFAQSFETAFATFKKGTVLSSAVVYPTVRSDIHQIREMTTYLNKLTKDNGKKVYVLASSSILNGSIVSNAFMPDTLYAIPSLLSTHDVDLRDGFPNAFFLADYVVVTDPVQYHLRPEDQKVIGVLANLFQQNKENNFKLVKKFQLDNNVRAKVYEKVHAFNREWINQVSYEFNSSYPNNTLLTNINQLSPLINSIELKNQHMQVWDDQGTLMVDCWSSRRLTIPLSLNEDYKELAFSLTNVGQQKPVHSKRILVEFYYDGKKMQSNTILANHPEKVHLDVQNVNSLKMVFKVQNSDSANNPITISNIQVK
ncbi:hypothetical protein ABWW58_10520 [Sporolactobacillus sp. STCC-11]|uniref:hypothetical protein n=1 Tax=Sporolactobacillus caesalpiniae TaxID=3230362 RepID=UPI00339697C0